MAGLAAAHALSLEPCSGREAPLVLAAWRVWAACTAQAAQAPGEAVMLPAAQQRPAAAEGRLLLREGMVVQGQQAVAAAEPFLTSSLSTPTWLALEQQQEGAGRQGLPSASQEGAAVLEARLVLVWLSRVLRR